MNGFPPLPPFFPSSHRLPGHPTTLARQQRRRTDAVIMPPEARIARRIFGLDEDGWTPRGRPARPPTATQQDGEASRIPSLARLLWKILRALARPGG